MGAREGAGGDGWVGGVLDAEGRREGLDVDFFPDRLKPPLR